MGTRMTTPEFDDATKRRRPWVWVAGLLWVGVLAAAIVWGVDRFQTDIGDRAEDTLRANGFAGLEVDVEGRDLHVMGADTADEARIAALLEDLEGVRMVVFDDMQVAAGTTTTETPAPVTSTQPSSETTTTEAPPQTTTTEAPPASTTTTTTTAAPQVAFVEATLQDGQFTLSGVVPDEATATALLTAANIAYAPFVTNELVIDPTAAPNPLLAAAPTGIGLIPMITEGTITVEGDGIELTGTAPLPEYSALFEQTISAVFGTSNVTSDVAITNLAPPLFDATRTDGRLVLSGDIPSERFREIVVGGAVAAYGAENVEDQMVVGDGLYESFWMYTMPGVFQLFAPFPDYNIHVENAITTGSMQNGANFAYGSAELNEQTQAVLSVAIALLTRDRSLTLRVEGHTDSDGSSGFNQGLSERRAGNAAAFVIAGGIDPARVLAVGFGEERPIASNATAEGRAQNRRVEFFFGPAEIVLAGQ